MATKDFSSIQEKRVAKRHSGEVQLGSGAVGLTGLKGDVKVSASENWSFLAECKTSATKPGQAGKRSLTLHKSWIKDVQTHAFDMGKSMGIVVVSFDNKEDFYLTSSIDFDNMHKAVIEYETELTTIKQMAKSILEDHNATAYDLAEFIEKIRDGKL